VSKFSLWLDKEMYNHGGRKYGAAALARDLSVRRATVSDWLNEIHQPTRVQIKMLAQHFGTTSRHIYELLELEPPSDLNDTLERVNAIAYRLNAQGLEKLLKELEGGRYEK
jgi:hypothetical protein